MHIYISFVRFGMDYDDRCFNPAESRLQCGEVSSVTPSLSFNQSRGGVTTKQRSSVIVPSVRFSLSGGGCHEIVAYTRACTASVLRSTTATLACTPICTCSSRRGRITMDHFPKPTNYSTASRAPVNSPEEGGVGKASSRLVDSIHDTR